MALYYNPAREEYKLLETHASLPRGKKPSYFSSTFFSGEDKALLEKTYVGEMYM